MNQPDAPIQLSVYQASWPAQFALERTHLLRVLVPWLAGEIEHIGSTAVPGLSAKPVIDIMAPVVSLELALPAIKALVTLSYCYYPYKPESMHWFCKPSPALRTHHLHLVPHNSPLWQERLAFRDALRASETLVAQYAALKRELALQFAGDRDGYTDAKAPFISRVIAGAAKQDSTGE